MDWICSNYCLCEHTTRMCHSPWENKFHHVQPCVVSVFFTRLWLLYINFWCWSGHAKIFKVNVKAWQVGRNLFTARGSKRNCSHIELEAWSISKQSPIKDFMVVEFKKTSFLCSAKKARESRLKSVALSGGHQNDLAFPLSARFQIQKYFSIDPFQLFKYSALINDPI